MAPAVGALGWRILLSNARQLTAPFAQYVPTERRCEWAASESPPAVVERLRGGKMIKGYIDSIPASDFDALRREALFLSPPEIGSHSAGLSRTLAGFAWARANLIQAGHLNTGLA